MALCELTTGEGTACSSTCSLGFIQREVHGLRHRTPGDLNGSTLDAGTRPFDEAVSAPPSLRAVVQRQPPGAENEQDEGECTQDVGPGFVQISKVGRHQGTQEQPCRKASEMRHYISAGS